jgi:hypothetical protein
MDEIGILDPLRRTVGALATWFQSEKLPYVFIGAVGLAFVSEPHTTRDVDVITSPSSGNRSGLASILGKSILRGHRTARESKDVG